MTTDDLFELDSLFKYSWEKWPRGSDKYEFYLYHAHLNTEIRVDSKGLIFFCKKLKIAGSFEFILQGLIFHFFEGTKYISFR
ncbi:unnamed protein product [Allacma fusca]|uniref:Uncharacterized protein n=1 Tax=Allacma fusca TaxID=39272 RepID=A0A8J2LGJ4_9HEXA|nr:unnamed protein product [Allacma fusca]